MTVTRTSATTVAIGSVPAMGAEEIVIATASAETAAETEERPTGTRS